MVVAAEEDGNTAATVVENALIALGVFERSRWF